jgi:hypothetical protein
VLRASRAEMQGWVSFQYDLVVYAERALKQIRAILAILEKHFQAVVLRVFRLVLTAANLRGLLLCTTN